MLIGSKKDLEDVREVTYTEAKAWADENGSKTVKYCVFKLTRHNVYGNKFKDVRLFPCKSANFIQCRKRRRSIFAYCSDDFP